MIAKSLIFVGQSLYLFEVRNQILQGISGTVFVLRLAGMCQQDITNNFEWDFKQLVSLGGRVLIFVYSNDIHYTIYVDTVSRVLP